MFTITSLRPRGAVRDSAEFAMRILLSALSSALQWSQDTIPRALGLRVIPDLLPDRERSNDLKLPVRGYSQLDTYSCGVAAGWSVLRYFDPEANFRKFDQACAPHPEWGTSTRRLATALRKHGLRVYGLGDLDFDAITSFLESGFPILTAIRERDWVENVHHWVVIYGAGWNPRRMHIVGRTGAPGFAKMELAWRKFKTIWSFKGEGLVCVPRGVAVRRKRKQAPRHRRGRQTLTTTRKEASWRDPAIIPRRSIGRSSRRSTMPRRPGASR
jgi:hypothetical protein